MDWLSFFAGGAAGLLAGIPLGAAVGAVAELWLAASRDDDDELFDPALAEWRPAVTEETR